MRLIDADKLPKYTGYALSASEVAIAVENAPTIDAVPVVRGKWRLYSPLTDTYECDKCGYQVIDESFRTNFCPNCGADMREPQMLKNASQNADADVMMPAT